MECETQWHMLCQKRFGSSIIIHPCTFFFLHLAYYKCLKEQTACRYTNCHTIMNNLLFSPLFISNQP